MKYAILFAILLISLSSLGCTAPKGKILQVPESETIQDFPPPLAETQAMEPVVNQSGSPAGGPASDTGQASRQSVTGIGTGYTYPITPLSIPGTSPLLSGPATALQTISPPVQSLPQVSIPVPMPPALPITPLVPPSVPVPSPPPLTPASPAPVPAPQTQTVTALPTPPLPATPAGQTSIPIPVSPTTRQT